MGPTYAAAITTHVGLPRENVVGLVQTVRRIGEATLIALVSGIHFKPGQGAAAQKAAALEVLDILVWIGGITAILVWVYFAHHLWNRSRLGDDPRPET